MLQERFRAKTCVGGVACLLAAIAVPLAVAQGINLDEGTVVMRVEEDWEAVLNDPGQDLTAPQFHTTVSHDSEGEPVNVDDTDASETETVTLTGAGLYQARSGVYGFLLPRARIFVGGRASPDEGSFEFLIGVPGEDFTSGR